MPEHLAPKLINWASILEENTAEQAIRASAMPFIFPHLALMPDAHLGKGATVGSVIPTDGAIMPAAVGVDIGCGMMAIRTQFTADDVRSVEEEAPGGLTRLHADILRRIPVSAGGYNNSQNGVSSDNIDDRLDELSFATPGADQATAVARNWTQQLGSLGSGNHFIEISLDELNRVWLFLHSGSRGVGNKLAQKWIKAAQEHAKRNFITLPDPDLAYLVEGTDDFDGYIEALTWAQRFAYLNREEMMDRVVTAVGDYFGEEPERRQTVNCHHNYTARETHFGREVWLSRKGAIDAHDGVPGLIPGSMGDASYVVTGKGNPLALCSSPHGAGRAYGRKRAEKLFTRDDLDERMTGIVWGNSDAFLDEHPSAYKPIDTVMDDAADLVEVEHVLRQIVNVKGD